MPENPTASVPLAVRVQLAHACVQAVADAADLHLLHLKGPAFDPDLRPGREGGSDVDVLVHPDHLRELWDLLLAHGWRVESTFEQGSSFQHAANFYHPDWGLLDVHRTYPGLPDARASFELLWQRRAVSLIAHRPCPVPDRTAQSVLLLLHAARTPSSGSGDISANWTERSEADQARIRALVDELGAQVGFAAATGTLDEVAGAPEAELWRVFVEDGSRLDEWRARWRAASGGRAKLAVLRHAVSVNTYVLEHRLGRPPTRRDLVVEQGRRVVQAVRDGGRALHSRLGGRR